MVDRVKPLKIESPDSGGVETDEFPTSLDKNEDFVDCRGVTIQDDSSDDDLVRVSRDGDDLTFLDKNNTEKTLTDLVAGTGGLTADSHRVLDQLVHGLAEDYYEEYTYSGSKVTNITVWTDSGKTKKIREEQYMYTGPRITQAVTIQYDSDGNEFERLTESYTYAFGNRVDHVDAVRSVP